MTQIDNDLLMTEIDDAAAFGTSVLAHFSAKLAFETDVSDVHAALTSVTLASAALTTTTTPAAGFVLVDSRSEQAWDQGRIPGAVHLPTRRIAAEALGLIPAGTPVITYCWGPGCNGATRAALEFARLGYPVKEMIGGFEYWVREGFAYDTAWGPRTPAADRLTAPVDGAACA
jgi:rhodanese-related sulfurtransferase